MVTVSNMILELILIVTISLGSVQSQCDSQPLGSIKNFWNDKPPTNLLSSYSGTWTYIKVSSKDAKSNAQLKCFQEVVHEDRKSATLRMDFDNPENNVKIPLKLEEKPGIIVKKYNINQQAIEEYHYVLYFHQGVMAFWRCSKDRPPHNGILVKEYSKFKDDQNTQDAIQKAEEALKQVGLHHPEGIQTVC